MVLNNLGDVHLKQGQHAKALEHFQKALAIRQGALGAEHFDVAKDLLGIGETYLAMRRLPDSLSALERALALREGRPGFPTTLARIRFDLAQALWESGKDQARARTLAAQAREAYANGGPGNASERAAVDAWLARHGGGLNSASLDFK
jgi:tetratricopeptide (TPR) repeat protein